MVEDSADRLHLQEDEGTEGKKTDQSSVGNGDARSFVDQFARRAAESLHNDYAASPARIINSEDNAKELWGIIHELNDTRIVQEPRSYDDLKGDLRVLEEYIADAATRQSRFREQAVSERIKARAYWPGSHFAAEVIEEEADLHDAVAAEAGRGAVIQYRQLESGEEIRTDEALRDYLGNFYAEASGWVDKEKAAKADVDAGKPQPLGVPEDYQWILIHTKTQVAREKDLANNDFANVYGSSGGVEALVRRKAILESRAWKDRQKAAGAADNPGRKMWGRGKVVGQAVARANEAKTVAYKAGDAAVEKFRNFQATR